MSNSMIAPGAETPGAEQVAAVSSTQCLAGLEQALLQLNRGRAPGQLIKIMTKLLPSDARVGIHWIFHGTLRWGMLPITTLLKRFCVCAALTVFAQHAFAAVLILEGRVPPAPEPSVTSTPGNMAPQDEPSGPPPSAPSQLTPPSDSAIPKPATGPTSASPAAGGIAPSSPTVSNDLRTGKVANSAEVSVEMLPGQTVSVGSRVSFRVTSKKAGYLVLLDVDATGHLTQIYPNTASLVRAARPNGNYIKPGRTLAIPLATDPSGRVEYVVSPPSGQAMVVAILSAQPVQILDLPDVPPEVKSQSDTLAYLAKWTSELRIPDDTTSQLREAKWSFNAKSYIIQ